MHQRRFDAFSTSYLSNNGNAQSNNNILRCSACLYRNIFRAMPDKLENLQGQAPGNIHFANSLPSLPLTSSPPPHPTEFPFLFPAMAIIHTHPGRSKIVTATTVRLDKGPSSSAVTGPVRKVTLHFPQPHDEEPAPASNIKPVLTTTPHILLFL